MEGFNLKDADPDTLKENISFLNLQLLKIQFGDSIQKSFDESIERISNILFTIKFIKEAFGA